MEWSNIQDWNNTTEWQTNGGVKAMLILQQLVLTLCWDRRPRISGIRKLPMN